jgi:hypothetical protein
MGIAINARACPGSIAEHDCNLYLGRREYLTQNEALPVYRSHR